MLSTVLLIMLAGACAGSIDVIKHGGSEINIEEKWNKLMLSTGIKTKGDDGISFNVTKKIKRMYGYDIIVSIPDGLTFTALESIEEQIKGCFRCEEVNIRYVRQSNSAYIRLIKDPIADDTPFQPVLVNPWEVYLGTTKYYKDIIVNMRTYPHGIITGVTGAGKSVFTICTILNMIINHTDKDVNVYLNEIADKDDFKAFRNCDIVKGYSRTLSEATKILQHLYDEMGRRNKLFNNCNDDDIYELYDYNTKYPHKALPWIYFFTDEYSLFMEDESDSDTDDFYKKQCQALMKKMAKLARNAGIFIFSSLQRPDKESMPPIFKTNLNVSIAFKQKNTASALTALDSTKPMELKMREAIVDFGGDQFIIYSLYLNKFTLKCYLENKKEQSQCVDLSLYDWLDQQAKKHKKDGKGKGKKKGKEQANESEVAPTSSNLGEVISIENQPKKKGKGVVERANAKR